MGAPPTYTAARRDSGLFVLMAAYPIIAAAVDAPAALEILISRIIQVSQIR